MCSVRGLHPRAAALARPGDGQRTPGKQHSVLFSVVRAPGKMSSGHFSARTGRQAHGGGTRSVTDEVPRAKGRISKRLPPRGDRSARKNVRWTFFSGGRAAAPVAGWPKARLREFPTPNPIFSPHRQPRGGKRQPLGRFPFSPTPPFSFQTCVARNPDIIPRSGGKRMGFALRSFG